MSTYIRAVVAAKAIAEKYGIPLGDLVDTFADIPVSDVAPVVHGRWEFGKDLPDSFGSINKNKYHLYCSECRNQAFNKTVDNDYDFDMDTPYCPNCGGKDGQGGITMYNEMCGDNRFEIIAEAKRQLLEYTNIETSPDEMAVIDSFLFRCWQMGWLKSLDKEDA